MKISVAMATYNGAKFLDEQIQSILLQTLKPAEIIVCDDGSTDGTIQLLEKYQRSGDLQFFVNPQRLGLIRNFKKAVSLCISNNYIALSDQDDIWLPQKLEKLAEVMDEIEDKNLPCLAYCDLTLIDADKNVLNTSFRNEAGQDKYARNLQSLLFNNFVNGCSTLINENLRAYFDDIPEGIYFNHDGWLSLIAYTFGKAKDINNSLVLYRKHDGNFSIEAGAKKRTRYQNIWNELLSAIKNNDSFLTEQFVAVQQFEITYRRIMSNETRLIFKDFLKLKNRSYPIKKLAYRQMINKNRVIKVK